MVMVLVLQPSTTVSTSYDQAIFFDYTAQLMDGVSVTVGVQDFKRRCFRRFLT